MALAAGVPGDRLIVHGNNKSDAEVALAVRVGAHRLVLDSFDEIDRVERIASEHGAQPSILVRVNPGIDAHTHEYLRTGAIDSKFGFGLSSGAAAEAVERAKRSSRIDFVGVHAHIGSQVFDTSS
ncbi:MAG: diaminopimelate decarboxylase, partial [Acidobacteria bacterium]|nr:diaminopimelate decarboxylase [Acidobacteriota bacterium]NIQ87226.1 diaminopimelate decarboxylase [Acidobacteriota bacterium]